MLTALATLGVVVARCCLTMFKQSKAAGRYGKHLGGQQLQLQLQWQLK